MIFYNEMGTFSPFLSEIQQLEPLDTQNKGWKIYLENQSLFLAELRQETLELHLALGPKTLELPLSFIQRMSRENLLYPSQSHSYFDASSTAGTTTSPGDSGGSGFFSNQLQKAAKEESSQRFLEQQKK
jgi:hypothetical protein